MKARTLQYFLFLSLVAPLAPAGAQATWCEGPKLSASDGSADSHFGARLARSGNLAVVGAPWENSGGAVAGAAYVFEKGAAGWVETHKLVPLDLAPGDGFGSAVAVHGRTLVVGAPFDDSNGYRAGAAYVFEEVLGLWTQVAELQHFWGGASGDSFGHSVSVSASLILVGAPDDETGFPQVETGAVHAFHRVGGTWDPLAFTVINGRTSFDQFGWSLAQDAATAVIGAVSAYAGAGLTSSGLAYVYSIASGFSFVAELRGASPGAFDSFGASVAVDGSRIVVGAPGWNGLREGVGAAYVFEDSGSGWVEVEQLVAVGGAKNENLGANVALSGGRVALAASKTHSGKTRAGMVYLFEGAGTSWSLSNKLVASEPKLLHFFGSALDLKGDELFVGARGDNGLGLQAGAAFVLDASAVSSVELVRLGTPPNPDALRPGQGSGPVIGMTWDPRIDHASFASAATLDFLAVDLRAAINVATPLGTLLCQPPPVGQIFFAAAGLSFAVPIPGDCGFVGLAACAQGGSLTPGAGIELTNALDLVVGK